MPSRREQAQVDGRVFQEEFFGMKVEYSQDILSKLRQQRNNFELLIMSVADNQRNQRWNPHMPKTTLASELFQKIRAHLTPHEGSKLLLYSALGSALDFFYKIDGFFSLHPRCNNVVTFDLALKQSVDKREDQKANIIITKEELLDPELSIYLASDIARFLTRDISSSTRNRWQLRTHVGPLT